MSIWLSQRHNMPLSLSWQQEQCIFVEHKTSLQMLSKQERKLCECTAAKVGLVQD